MNSPTHSLLALALLSRRGQKKRNWAVLIGSLLPDVIIYIWAPYQSFVKGEDASAIWGTLYFQDPMQTLIAFFNSVPIYAGLALIGYLNRAKMAGKLILFFALAALIHMATDFPVHNHDAYRHFWPLTDWRFYSPISYWEHAFHAGWVSLIEAVIGLTSIVVLWQRFPKRWVKVILGVLALFYIAMPIAIALAPTVFAS